MPVLIVLVGLFLGLFVMDSATAAAHALWPVVVLGGLAFAALALIAWHRRQMAYLQQQHLVTLGRWANVELHRPWPKYCTDCGQEATSWRPATAHDDPTSSPCMAARLARDAAEAAPGLPMSGFTAEVIDDQQQADEGPPKPAEDAKRARSRQIVDALRARRE